MYQKEEGNEARFPLKDSTAAEQVDAFDDIEDIELVHSKDISRYSNSRRRKTLACLLENSNGNSDRQEIRRNERHEKLSNIGNVHIIDVQSTEQHMVGNTARFFLPDTKVHKSDNIFDSVESIQFVHMKNNASHITRRRTVSCTIENSQIISNLYHSSRDERDAESDENMSITGTVHNVRADVH